MTLQADWLQKMQPEATPLLLLLLRHPLPCSSPPRPPTLSLLPPSIRPSTLPSLWMVGWCVSERTQDAAPGLPFQSDGDGLRRRHQVRPAQTQPPGAREEFPIPEGERRRSRRGQRAGEGGRTQEVKTGTMTNLLFVCFCWSCDGEGAVITVGFFFFLSNTPKRINGCKGDINEPCWIFFLKIDFRKSN